MQGFVFNLRRRDQFKDARFRRAFNYAFDFEEMNKQLFYRPVQAHRQLFRGHRARLARPAARRGAGNPRDACATRCRRRCSPRPTPIRSTAIRKRAQQSARGLRLLKEAGFEIRTRSWSTQTGKQVTVEILWRTIPGDERLILFYKPSLERLGITRQVRTVDNAQYENRMRSFDFDIIIDVVGAVAVARQRAARILGLAGGRPAGLAEYRRDQESGDRRTDREGHFRQGPRRPGGRHQGARPRAAVELLRRAAVHLRHVRATRAGTVSAMPSRCRNMASRASLAMVVGRGKGGEDRRTHR